ncbi:MAG: SAM-dependent methyltransferase [Flavobacteriia bacterium]|nr:SAM-dependent methyltransferase [Flavobacteriia bacterium]
MEKKRQPIGSLYLIPTTLGENEPLEVLPLSVKKIIEELDYFIVENEKTARRFIKKICPKKSQQSLQLETLNKFTDRTLLSSFLDPCSNGQSVGVISEAGCPGIADPGAEIVAIAHQKNIQVLPMVGPSSILLSLMASGFNGQSFAFNGYLPIDQKERTKAIKDLENIMIKKGQTQIFIETPYRNEALLASLCKTLLPNTMLCVACDISLENAFIKTENISYWNKNTPNLHKRPCIFLIGS